jgi:hypothetical protein
MTLAPTGERQNADFPVKSGDEGDRDSCPERNPDKMPQI